MENCWLWKCKFISRKERKKQYKIRIRYRLEKENKDFPEQKLANYPELGIIKLYHGCEIKDANCFNILIDKYYPCLLPTHCVHWFHANTKKFKMKNTRYITRSFYNTLK